MESENPNLIAALHYANDLGFSVIPVGQDKKPLAKWERYQHKKATQEEIEGWFKNPDVNVGVVTGAISGIVVVDIDTTEKIEQPLNPTVISKTGGGGWHYFYKHPGRNVKTRAGILPKVDIRGDGGYVVMPPSLHKSGNHYEWVMSPEDASFSELPTWVLEEEPKQKIEGTDWKSLIEKGVSEGTRNQTLAQLTGKMLHYLPQDLWETEWLTMKALNQSKINPPLPEEELRTIFDSIAGREAKERLKRDVPTRTSEIQAIPLSELMSTAFQTPQWLVERLIPHEAVTIVSGAPSSYKTFLLLEIALKVASGQKVFGEFQATQSPVLIIDEENHPRVLQERATLLSQNPNLPIFIASRKGFLLEKDSVEKLVWYARNKNVRLVIFDSFICIHGSDENVASEMRNVMKHLKDIASQGIAVIVIHHHRKKGRDGGSASQDIRGSSDILAQVDCHLAVERKTSRDASVTIQQSKLREAQEMEPFVVSLHSDGNSGNFEYVGHAKEKQDKKADLKLAIRKALEEADKPLNKAELWKLIEQSDVKVGHSTFKATMEEMVDNGDLFTKRGTKNAVLCSLKAFGADDG